MARHARQVQQQSKSIVRSTNVPIAELPTQDEVPFPMARHGAIGCFRWTLADHDLGRDEGLPRPRVRALGIRSGRPVRKHAVSSRRSAPRP